MTAGMMFLFGLVSVYLYRLWKSRIPFAQATLKTVIAVTELYPSTVFAAVMGMFAQTGFSLFALVSLFCLSQWTENAYVLVIYSLFTFFWTIQVMQNTVHTTISGLFGTFYFLGEAQADGTVHVPVANPTLKAARRAVTTSFGSVCYGSLLIALVQLIKTLVSQARQQASENNNPACSILLCCLECLVSMVEGLLEYFNKYAFTQVAVYGKDYCQAGKDTWELVKARGIDAVINDSLIEKVLGLGAFAVGCLSGAVGLLYVAISSLPQTDAYYFGIGGSFFLLGITTFSVLATVIDSGVATTFVCFAEDPETLKKNKPALYSKIQEVYPQVAMGF